MAVMDCFDLTSKRFSFLSMARAKLGHAKPDKCVGVMRAHLGVKSAFSQTQRALQEWNGFGRVFLQHMNFAGNQ
jgi:hypothetical protein